MTSVAINGAYQRLRSCPQTLHYSS